MDNERLRQTTRIGGSYVPPASTGYRCGAKWAPSTTSTSRSRPERARELIDAGEVQLVDVREPYEVEAGRIAGSRHIELERLASQADSIERDRPVLFYCRAGARSGMAANAFRRAGYEAST